MSQRFKKVMLGDIAIISSGGTPSRSNPQYWGGEIPWVKTTQIQNCVINENDIDECITEAGLAKSSAKMVPKGTVLIAMIGQGKTRGQVGLLNILATTNQNAASLVVREGVSNSYIFQSILHNYNGLRALSNDSGQGNLNLKLIKKFKIPYTDYSEQKAIADVLSTWDQAIEKMQQLIKAKEKQFDCLIQSLLLNKSSVDSDKVPEQLFEIISEKNCKNQELLSVTQDRGVIPRSMLEGRVMSPGGSLDGYKKVQVGDFVVSLRSFQGGIEYVYNQGLVSPAYTVLRPNSEVFPEYFKHFFKSPIFIKKYLAKSVVGIRDGKQISMPEFMGIKIPVPSINEQAKIAGCLSIAKKELTVLRNILKSYQTQKQGLMQRLLTGEWRTKF